MNPRKIRPAGGPVDARFAAVPSKSATHRALLAASLADGPSTIHNPLLADDTRTTRDGLIALGLESEGTDDAWNVQGRPHGPPGRGRVQLGDSGTSFRFLAALAALGHAPSTLDGSRRLRERPIGDLVRCLAALGATVVPAAAPASLPLTIGGTRLRGGRVRVPGDRSSQFASALLLIGARLPGGLDLEILPPVVSLPYVRLTLDVLREFGVEIEQRGEHRWEIRPTDYRGRRFTVEGDHSSASYLLAAPALLGGRVRVDGLHPASSQPDARLGPILDQLGCRVSRGSTWIEVEGQGRLAPFDLDLGEAPDLVPTLAVLALAADGPCVLRNIAHLRLKESDRLQALAVNLSALGRPATASDDRLTIAAPLPNSANDAAGVTIRTYSDHRMAMAFALAGLRVVGLGIDDPDCVAKSNPDFWSQFEKLTSTRG